MQRFNFFTIFKKKWPLVLDVGLVGKVYSLGFTHANHGPESDFELFTPIADDDGKGWFFSRQNRSTQKPNAVNFTGLNGF